MAHTFQAVTPFHWKISAGQPSFRVWAQPAKLGTGIQRSRLTFYAAKHYPAVPQLPCEHKPACSLLQPQPHPAGQVMASWVPRGRMALQHLRVRARSGHRQDDGRGIGPSLGPAQVHNGVELSLELCLEGVDGAELIRVVSIVEAQLTFLVVQVDADALGPSGQRQGSPWHAKGLVDLPFLQTNEPHAILRRLAQLPFAADRALDDAHTPLVPGAHDHLPVVLATGEALAGEDAIAGVKTLGVAVPVLVEATPHRRVTLEELQERMCCHWVQFQRLWSCKESMWDSGTPEGRGLQSTGTSWH